jgi:hypothetical protein
MVNGEPVAMRGFQPRNIIMAPVAPIAKGNKNKTAKLKVSQSRYYQ